MPPPGSLPPPLLWGTWCSLPLAHTRGTSSQCCQPGPDFEISFSSSFPHMCICSQHISTFQFTERSAGGDVWGTQSWEPGVLVPTCRSGETLSHTCTPRRRRWVHCGCSFVEDPKPRGSLTPPSASAMSLQGRNSAAALGPASLSAGWQSLSTLRQAPPSAAPAHEEGGLGPDHSICC